MKRKYPKYPLVMIEWVDHASEDAWQVVEDAKNDTKAHAIRTVGWLINETDKVYNVVQCVATDNDVSMRMIILKAAVLDYKVLRKNG